MRLVTKKKKKDWNQLSNTDQNLVVFLVSRSGNCKTAQELTAIAKNQNVVKQRNAKFRVICASDENLMKTCYTKTFSVFERDL